MTKEALYVPVFLTGWEHGSVVANTGGLCDAITNAARVTIDTGTVRTGTYSLKVAPAATNDSWRKDVSSGDAISVYVYLSSLPSGDMIVAHMGQTAGTDHKAGIGIRSTGEWALFHRHSAGAVVWGTSGPSAVAGEWTHIYFDEYTAGILNGWIDTTALTTLDTTAGHAGGNLGNGTLGNTALGTGTETLSLYFDDAAFFDAAFAHPAGAVEEYACEILIPNGEGTHSTAASFTDSGANSPPVNPHLLLDEIPAVTTDTDWVAQTTIGSGDYIELTLSDMTLTGEVIGVCIFGSRENNSGVSSSTITLQALDVNDANDTDNIFSGALITATPEFKGDSLQTRIAGSDPPAHWPVDDINALRLRIGFSTDVTPNPQVNMVFAEVASLTAVAAEEAGWGILLA